MGTFGPYTYILNKKILQGESLNFDSLNNEFERDTYSKTRRQEINESTGFKTVGVIGAEPELRRGEKKTIQEITPVTELAKHQVLLGTGGKPINLLTQRNLIPLDQIENPIQRGRYYVHKGGLT